jgi:formylglycine-generating enzyme required for sulfatase activity
VHPFLLEDRNAPGEKDPIVNATTVTISCDETTTQMGNDSANKSQTWGVGAGARLADLRSFAGAVALMVFGLLTSASAADFTWQKVGSIGNAANPETGLGRVTENFKISAFETTISQYAEFLNKSYVGKQGLYGVYNTNIGALINASTPQPSGVGITRSGAPGSYSYSAVSGFESKPVNNVNWFSAARFVNWYANDKSTSETATETGSYTLGSGQTSGPIVARNADAKVFLPSANEWTKAAFYNPATQSYSTWPTQSNTQPTPILPNGNDLVTTVNTANFRPETGSGLKMTNAGTYVNTTSTYGLFDLTGNVNEMTDTADGTNAAKFQALGGSWATNATTMTSFYSSNDVGEFKIGGDPTAAIGFRVAAVAVPEPGNMVAAAMGIAGLVGVQLAKRRKLALAQAAG